MRTLRNRGTVCRISVRTAKRDESVKNIKTEAGVEIGSVSTENVYQVNDSVSACNYDMWN